MLTFVSGFAVLAQFASVAMDRPITWDEAIYLSQVEPGTEALDFNAHRARGMVILVAPVALLSPDIAVVRTYLVLLTGFALWAAFRPWVHLIGSASPIAAAAYGLTWFVIVSGSEVFPNAFTALAVVAVAGSFAVYVTSRETSAYRLILVAAVCALALLRPTEAVWLCAALAPAAIGVPAARALRGLSAMLIGGVVGCVPWLVEAMIRWGGVATRLREMRRIAVGPRREVPVWRQYVSMIDGPFQEPVANLDVAGWAIAWSAVFVTLMLIGGAHLIRQGRTRLAVALAAGLLGVSLPYLAVNNHVYLRFLLPAYALACILAAVGLVVVGRRLRPYRGLRAAWLPLAVTGLLAWSLGQADLARETDAHLTAIRRPPVLVGRLLSERVEGRPCAVAAEIGWPQVAYVSGCHGERFRPDRPVTFARSDAYQHVFVVARSRPEPASLYGSWSAERLARLGVEDWVLYSRRER